MPQPTVSDVHVDAILTDISIAYMQDEGDYVAAAAFPLIPVAKQTDKYYTYERNDFLRDEAEKRGDAEESAGSGYTLSTDSYAADVWAFHKDIGAQARANSDAPLNPEDDATAFVSQKLLIRRERQWVTDFFTTSVWTTDVVGGVDFVVWSDAASDPEKDIQVGIEAIKKLTGFRPNTLTVSLTVHHALKRHPAIKDRFKYTSSESITNEMLSRFFEIDRYRVAEGIYATNVEGAATNTYDWIAGANALLTYSPASPGLMKPSAGYTFVWSGLTGINDLGIKSATFSRAAGVWRGKVERVLIVRIDGQSWPVIEMMTNALCRLLNQESIGYVPSRKMEFMS